MTQNTIISYNNDLNYFFVEMDIRSNDFDITADIRKWIDKMLHPTDIKPLAITTINRRFNS